MKAAEESREYFYIKRTRPRDEPRGRVFFIFAHTLPYIEEVREPETGQPIFATAAAREQDGASGGRKIVREH